MAKRIDRQPDGRYRITLPGICETLEFQRGFDLRTELEEAGAAFAYSGTRRGRLSIRNVRPEMVPRIVKQLTWAEGYEDMFDPECRSEHRRSSRAGRELERQWEEMR